MALPLPFARRTKFVSCWGAFLPAVGASRPVGHDPELSSTSNSPNGETKLARDASGIVRASVPEERAAVNTHSYGAVENCSIERAIAPTGSTSPRACKGADPARSGVEG